MTLSDVIQLFMLVGGTVLVTFQITWTVSNWKNGKKK